MLERLATKSHRHGEVRVNLAILEVLRHQRHKHVDLLFLPPQSTGEECQAETFKPFEAIDLVPATELFHERILRPAIGRPHELALLHVDETCLAHEVLVFVADVGAHGPADLPTSFAEQLAPFMDVGSDVSAVCGFDGKTVILQLKPAARLKVAGDCVSRQKAETFASCLYDSLVGLTEEVWPVLKTA